MIFRLLGNMNALYHLHPTVSIHTLAAKGFQMIHNWALISAGLSVELQRLGRAQVFGRISVQQVNVFTAFPKLRFANHSPIITTITVSIARTIGRDFLLFAQNGFHGVRMQVFVRTRVAL